MGSLATLDVLNVSLESINGATWIVENVEKNTTSPSPIIINAAGVCIFRFLRILGAGTVCRTLQVYIPALLLSMTAYISTNIHI